MSNYIKFDRTTQLNITQLEPGYPRVNMPSITKMSAQYKMSEPLNETNIEGNVGFS